MISIELENKAPNLILFSSIDKLPIAAAAEVEISGCDRSKHSLNSASSPIRPLLLYQEGTYSLHL